MIRLACVGFLAALFASVSAAAQTCSVPNTLTNGATADASQVMANFNAILTCVNAGATTQPIPQGRLTLTSNTPVMTSDVTAATTIYYTPYVGSRVPIYNGTAFVLFSFTQLSAITVAGNQQANQLYDLFVFSNAGTAQIGFGPAWSSSTAGSSTRGTGTGTTQLQQVQGLWTNANIITLLNSSTTYSNIAANQATYVGTVAITSTAGQTAMQFKPAAASGGSGSFMGVYNAYNRVQTVGTSRDNNNWFYATNSWRKADNSASNSVTYIDGLGQSIVEAHYYVTNSAGSPTNGVCTVGINFDSLTASPGGWTAQGVIVNTGQEQTLVARDQLTSIGLHYAQAMEIANSNDPQFITNALTVRLDM